MSASPAFAATPALGVAVLGTRNSTLANTATNKSSVLVAGASGTRIDAVAFNALGTTIAGTIQLWLFDGTNYRLRDQVAVQAITQSTTATGFNVYRPYSELILPTGWTLVSDHLAAAGGNDNLLVVVAHGGHY